MCVRTNRINNNFSKEKFINCILDMPLDASPERNHDLGARAKKIKPTKHSKLHVSYISHRICVQLPFMKHEIVFITVQIRWY